MDVKFYEDALNKIVADPDLAGQTVLDIMDNIRTDAEAMATLEASVTEMDGKIKDMRDLNAKLLSSELLRTTGELQKQEDDGPDIDEMSFDEYVNYLKNKEEK